MPLHYSNSHTMAKYYSFLSLGLCFLVLFQACSAQIGEIISARGSRVWPTVTDQRGQRSQQDECQLERINALEPSRTIESEAGVTDVWDENDEQFRCAGVVAIRHTIQQRGLLLPHYANGPKLIYVVQGRGVQGAVFPGCPETYQSPSQSQEGGYGLRGRPRRDDQHQKVRQIREGDVLALPAGVAQWVHNNGRSPLVLVQIIDTSNAANQLDENHRVFFVGGNPQEEIQSLRGQYRGSKWTIERGSGSGSSRGQGRSSNIFSGLDERVLAQAFNINTDVARKLKCENDNRGMIVSVVRELELLTPEQSQEEEREESEEERERVFERSPGSRCINGAEECNGAEETLCTARLKHSIDNPSRADVYNPRAGRVTNVNSLNLPILQHLRLSIQRTVLYPRAIMGPHWNMNAHSVCYFTRGNGHVQIVDHRGESVFDGQVQEGQIVTVPQNFVVIKRAGRQGLEWVSFKTNDNAKIHDLAGRVSAIRALPVEVLANAFQVSREDATRLKQNREEVTVFSPGSRSSSPY